MDRRVPWAKVAGLGVLGIVAALYTIEAFQIETPPSVPDVGPGFLPRAIGVILLVLTAVAILRALVKDDASRERANPMAAFVFIAATAGGVVLFLTIPWPIALGIYLIAVLTLLNRGQLVTNIALSAGLPVLLYLVFSVALDANLPA